MKLDPCAWILRSLLVALAVQTVASVPCQAEEETGQAPTAALRRLGSVAFRHPGLVNAVACSPDGMLIAASSMDAHANSVRVWDRETGRLIHDLPLEGDAPFCVAFSPDGRLLVTAGSGDWVRCWDVTTGTLVRSIPMVPTPDGSDDGAWIGMSSMRSHVSAAVFSPDGRALALGGDCRKSFTRTTVKPGTPETRAEELVTVCLRVVDPSTGREIQRFEGHERGVCDVAFSPDGKVLAAADEGSIKVWNVESGRLLFTCGADDATGRPRSVAFSPDGKDLLAGFDVSVRVLDAKTGALEHVLTRQGTVSAVVFSPDGAIAASTCWKTVHLWNTADWSKIRAFEGHTRHVTALAFVLGAEELLVGACGHLLRIWDLASGTQVPAPQGHEDAVVDLAVSSDGERIVSGGRDETVRLWDTKTGKARGLVGTHKGGVTAVAFSPDGTLLASSGYDQHVRLWNGTTGAAVGTIQPKMYGMEKIAFSPDGAYLVIGGRDGSLLFQDLATQRPLGTLERLAGDGGLTTDLAFSPDGKRLASAHQSGPVFLLEPATREIRLRLEPVHGWANALAFSPDGSRLAVAGFGGDVKVLDASSGAVILEMRQPAAAQDVAWSPDGGAIASCGADGSVLLWDARSGDALRRYAGHDGPARALAFTPGGRRLVSAGADTTILIWAVPPSAPDRNAQESDSVEQSAVSEPK